MITQCASRQTGVALLAALVLVMTVVIIMGNIFYRHQINVAQTALSLHQDQANLLALGAESWARQLLEDDDPKYDHFDEIWAQAIPAMPVEGGLINGCISDLQGRFNLNNFAKVNSADLSRAFSENKANFPKIWHYLLNLQEIPVFPGRVASIIDWVDKKSILISVDGAEHDEYAGLMPPRMVGDGPMVEPSELAAVMGYEIFEVQQLMPWITALPITTPSSLTPTATKININTASDELLLALGGTTYDLQFRDAVIANRPFDEMPKFYDQINAELAILDAATRWPNTLVDIKSEYFQLYIEVILGEARIEVNSIIRRSGGKLDIISRDLTTVPVSIEKNSTSVLFEKLASTAGFGSDNEVEEAMDNRQVQPACLMIGA